jgi:histidine triad (HIT) family protein
MTATEACIFCRIAADGAEHEVIARSERAIAFMNAYPAGYGHVLVIPKAHAENIWDVSEEDATSVWQLARRVASAARDGLEAEGLNLFPTNGRVAWQSVFHFPRARRSAMGRRRARAELDRTAREPCRDHQGGGGAASRARELSSV